jgi:dihydroflavonol-4-reductase
VPGLALLTGANGFVGSHLADLLVERNWRVRALVRRTSDIRWLPRDRVELCYGDLGDPLSLKAAASGVDVVFHAAAVTGVTARGNYLEVNTQGTRRLTEAALAGSPGLSRLVLVSSLAAGGASLPDRPRTEDQPDAPEDGYGRSKQAAEEAMRKAAGDVPWTVARPAVVYGPRDKGLLILARMVARGWNVRIGGPSQPVSLIHARDLAEGLLAAAESPAAVGKVYYLGPSTTPGWTQLGDLMARLLGVRARAIPVPRALVPAVSRASAVLSAALRKPNPFPPDRVRNLLAPAWTCDQSRAERDLGFEARYELEPGMRETMAWYRSEGWV